MSRQKNIESLEQLTELLGAEALLKELVLNTMSSDEAQENLEHIARMWDIGQDEEDEQEGE
jgi:hypothetical protein